MIALTRLLSFKSKKFLYLHLSNGLKLSTSKFSFMRYLLITSLLLGLIFTKVGFGNGPLKEIRLALEAGNAKELASYFHKEVKLGLSGEKGTYNPRKAEKKLKKFLQRYNPETFNTLHQGNSQEDAEYIIGKLRTGKKDFRTYLLISKSQDNQPIIRELRFQ